MLVHANCIGVLLCRLLAATALTMQASQANVALMPPWLCASPKLRTCRCEVPLEIIDALPRLETRIFYLELMWPLAAVYVWTTTCINSYHLFYEYNDGAEHNLLKRFSNHFSASFLFAISGGAAAVHRSHP